jgi:hypothetical protein
MLVGAPTASAGKLTDRLYGDLGTRGGQFNEPRGLAVNATGAGAADPGDLYVVDQLNQRVQVLGADGAFKFAFGNDVTGNEQQRVLVSATGGTYTLTFNGSTTAAIAYNATSATVDNALDVLPTIGGDANVAVSGSLAAGYVVTFQGTMAGTDVPQMTADSAGLSGGAATVTIQTLNDGAGGSFVGFERCTAANTCKAGTVASGAGAFDDPAGIAINETGAGPADPGDVYVFDEDNQRIQQFNASGDFVRMWGWGVDDGSAAFQVCDVADIPCQVGAVGNGLGQFANPGSFDINGTSTGIAVDQATGDVWAVDRTNRRFQRFAGDGDSPEAHGRAEIDSADYGASDDAFGSIGLGAQPRHIAVGLDGVIYVGSSSSNGNTVKIVRYDPAAGEFLRRLGGNETASGPLGTDGPLSGLAIDRDTGNLLVARNGTAAGAAAVQEFELDGVGPDEGLEQEDLVDLHAVGFGSQHKHGGLAVDPASEELLLSSLDMDSIAVLDDDGANPSPTVAIFPPTAVGSTTATFHADIDPVLTEDFPTRYRFEVSKDGVTWTEASPPANPDPLVGGGGFTRDQSVEKAATGLEPNTTYLVRVVTSRDPAAGSASSSELVFKTDPDPPAVTTDGAAPISATGAQLNGRINPGGLATEYWFEWGDDSYGNVVPVPAATLEAGPSARGVGETIGGLEPESVYHFRLCARNALAGDPVCGVDRTFTTLETPSEAPAGRAYEMVTSADKPARSGSQGVGGAYPRDFDRANASLPSTSGSPVRWELFPSATSGEANHAFTWAETQEDYSRLPLGWFPKSITNVAPRFGATNAFLNDAGTSSDLVTSAWYTATPLFDNFQDGNAGSNTALRVMGDEGGPRGAGWYPWVDPAWYDTSTGTVQGLAWSARIDDAGRRLIGSPVASSSGQAFREVTPADGGASPKNLAPPQTAGKALFLSGPEVDWRPGDLINECTGVAAGATLVPARDDNGTVAGPAGGPFSVTANFAAGGVTLQSQFSNLPSGILPGHFVTGAGIAPGTRVVSVDSLTQVTFDTPTTASGTFASVTIGQNTAALADDKIANRACEQGSPTDARGADIAGAGQLGGSSITAMSDSGNRVFFMSPDPGIANATCGPDGGAATACPPQLFVRSYDDAGQASVRWISRAENALFNAPQHPDTMGRGVAFEGASRDGSVVYFRTNAPLLENDPNGGVSRTTGASPLSWDLYSYRLADDDDPAPAGADPAGRLSRVTAGPDPASSPQDPNTNCTSVAANCGGAGNGGGGVVRFMSDDGQRVYLVTAAQIPGAANNPPAGGTTNPTAAGAQANMTDRNLYLYDASKTGAAAYEFVARIPFVAASTNDPSRSMDSCASYGSAALGAAVEITGPNELGLRRNANCVHGTTSGDAIVFQTRGQLTADDVDSAIDVYLYEASSDRLTRLSAPRPGSTPYTCRPGSSVTETCNADFGVVSPDFALITDNFGLAGLRHWNIAENSDGSLKAVYFQSRLALTASDVNGAGAANYTGGQGVMDVYQWRHGKLSLISPGNSPDSAFYSGNSLDGERVFFWTEQRISPWEIDPADGDLYTAAVGNGLPGPVAEPPLCGAVVGACQGGGVAPVPTDPRTDTVGDVDNADPGPRQTLSVSAIGAKARARAARTGRLAVRVSTTTEGRISAVAKGKIGKRRMVLARSSKQVRRPGNTTIVLRLNGAARKALRRGRTLSLSLEVRQPEVRPRSMTVRLRRAGS